MKKIHDQTDAFIEREDAVLQYKSFSDVVCGLYVAVEVEQLQERHRERRHLHQVLNH